MTDPLITLQNITVRLRDRWYLRNTAWEIKQGEHWAVLGPNGSGKTTLVKTLAGQIPVVKGKVQRHGLAKDSHPESIHFVSPEQRCTLFREEEILDQARSFSGNIFETTQSRDLFKSVLEKSDRDALKQLQSFCRQLDCTDILDRPLSSLSSGEMTKLLLVRALLSRPALLILDEPFDGLDQSSRKKLEKILSRLMDQGTHLLLVTHRMDEIFAGITHVLLMDDGCIAAAGQKEKILGNGKVQNFFGNGVPKTYLDNRLPQEEVFQKIVSSPSVSLIEMEQVQVRYGTVQVLDQVSWTMNCGENWAISGPNGSGKSTLLSLITGDELQAYANSIQIFGRKKGSGESVWDMKNKIGTVSHGLFTRYQKQLTVFETVCSGFFDSIGLYRFCNSDQRKAAREWIRLLGLEALQDRPFLQLSQGQRELVLITRAMVKSPVLLILDEPCVGLDFITRKHVLDLIELIGSRTATNLIYVTHHQDELLPCITHHLRLDAGRVVSSGTILVKDAQTQP